MTKKDDVHIIDNNNPYLTIPMKGEKIFPVEFTRCHLFEEHLRNKQMYSASRDIRLVTCKACLALLGEDLAIGMEKVSVYLSEKKKEQEKLFSQPMLPIDTLKQSIMDVVKEFHEQTEIPVTDIAIDWVVNHSRQQQITTYIMTNISISFGNIKSSAFSNGEKNK